MPLAALTSHLVSPLVTPLVHLAAEEHPAKVNPFFIGGGVLLIFIVLVVGLLSFGAGRDHT